MLGILLEFEANLLPNADDCFLLAGYIVHATAMPAALWWLFSLRATNESGMVT